MRFNTFKSRVLFFALTSLLFVTNTQLNAQGKSSTVKGVVVDGKNDPVPATSVIIRNTKTNFTSGTTTDSTGAFTFSQVSPGGPYSFTFSAVGFEGQVLSGYNLQEDAVLSLSVQLKSLTLSLDQVVVVGYGSQKRKDLTGAVASVSSKDIQDLPVTRVDQALAGKVAGVQVKMVSGEPGAAPQIRIRGIGSISAGGSPLYVVDGFPVPSIESLNPNDIASLDILKDASATAIYGSRGSNGVVIISTRRGASGKANISFNTYIGWQEASLVPQYMNAKEIAAYHFEGIKQNNIDLGNSIAGAPGTWAIPVPPTTLQVLSGELTYDRFAIDDVLRNALIQNYQLTATGGNENVKYAISGEYMDQEGIILGSDFKRYSLRANIDAKLAKKLTLKINVNPSFIERNLITASGSSSASNEGIVGSAFGVNPMYPLLNPDGSYYVFIPGLDVTSNAQNPLALAQEILNKQKSINIFSNASLEYKIMEDLRFTVMGGAILQNNKGYRFKPQIPAFFNEPAFGTDNSMMSYNWLSEFTLNYNKSFGDHNISALAGYTVQKETTEMNTMSSNRYPNNLVPTLNATSGVITTGSSEIFEWSLLSYLGRVNYNYRNKYYLTGSLRSDGSSRFGSDSKYGVFPSAAVSWRVSEEKFLKNVKAIGELKIRASYGETGNNNIGNYEQFATINYDRYILGNAVAGGFSQAKLANPNLTWEKQRQLNLGLDITLLKSRIRLSVDRFWSVNNDLLLNVNVPDITGFSTSLQNIGEVKNRGWDFDISTNNINGKDFQWSTDFNISTFKNEVVKLGPTGDPIYGGNSHITMIGQPIGMFYGWITDGVFLSQAELDKGPIYNPGGVDRSRVGDIRFKDLSGPDGKPDGVINNFDKDIIGSPYPDFYYGMTNRFSYKNISFSIALQGSNGAQIFDEARAASMATRGRFPQLAILNNYWKSEQEPGDGMTPRPNNAPTGNIRGQYSTWFLDTGTFMRITNMTLAYVLPDRLTNKMGLRAVRVYAGANNPFTFTKNLGFNPEASNLEDPLRPGRAFSDYPVPKSFVFGLNLSFNN